MTKTSKNIVVISRDDDAHIPYVQKHLKSSLHCIDPISILKNVELSYDPKSSNVIYNGTHLQSIHAVWFRKPESAYDIDIPVHADYRDYCKRSLSQFTNNLKVAFPNAFWLSDYYAVAKAENKYGQLVLAQKVGFLIPDTIMTSSVSRAKAFMEKYDEVIVKPFSSKSPNVGDISVLPAMKIAKHDQEHLHGLHLAPAIFQQAIPVKAELRVTVVGEKVFTAVIEDTGVDEVKEVRDWRVAHMFGRTTFRPYELTQKISDKCVALVKKMGLQFGAIDLIIDRDDTIWFLEINPNGQWAFIEENTSQPIGKAIAELLEKG